MSCAAIAIIWKFVFFQLESPATHVKYTHIKY